MDFAQDSVKKTRAERALWVARLAQIWHVIHAALEQGQPLPQGEITAFAETVKDLRKLLTGEQWLSVDTALADVESYLISRDPAADPLSADDLYCLAQLQLLLEKLLVGEPRQDEVELKSECIVVTQRFRLNSIQRRTEEKLAEEVENSAEHVRSEERNSLLALSQSELSLFLIVCEDHAAVIENRLHTISALALKRVFGQKSCYIFATDLESELVQDIVEVPLIALEKNSELENQITSLLKEVAESEANPSAIEPTGTVDAPVKSADVVPDRTQEFSTTHSESPYHMASQDIVDDFIDNAEKLLESLTESLLAFEKNSFQSETLDEMFRHAHTLKGTAAMLGYRVIEKLCHSMENLLDRMRKKQVSPQRNLVDVLFSGLDRLRDLISLLRTGASPVCPIDDVLQLFEKGDESHAQDAAHGGVELVLNSSVNESPDGGHSSGERSKPSDTSGSSNTSIRIDLKRLDTLVNLVGELAVDKARFARIEELMKARAGSTEFSRLMSESLLILDRHMNEAQTLIMKMRMIPISTTFSKFTRVVRDISKQSGKDVELVTVGGETELDKTMVEELYDPLVHLIRNSVDHGIESPDVRESSGKASRGTVRLSASQQGNLIFVRVEDDGRGLDVEKIRRRAIERGLIKDSDPMSHQDCVNLIFEPGFSTADAVTALSGRGVGLDVVKKNIQKLKGMIELHTEQGQGTTFTIKLPMTLALVPSLMVDAGGERFAVPLVNVIESLRISTDKIRKVGRQEFVKIRDELVPLVDLSQVFGTSERQNNQTSRSDVPTSTMAALRKSFVFVMIGSGHQRLGIIVDRLLGQQEIVIKSLGDLLGKVFGVAGGCVLEDGRVALVLDIAEVISDLSATRGGYETRAS
ncbi:MAG: hypothetical protein RIR26_1148 [Pseudomonadota bacterium]